MSSILALLLSLGMARHCQAQELGFRALPDVETQARALLRLLPEERGLAFGPPVVNSDDISFFLRDKSAEGSNVGILRLLDRHAGPGILMRRSASFAFKIDTFTPDEDGRLLSYLIAATRAVQKNDDGTFKRASMYSDSGTPPFAVSTGVMTRVEPGALLVFFLPLAAWLFWLRGSSGNAPEGGLRVSAAIKPVHVLQTIVQGTIFLYWGLYWRSAWQHLPFMGLQLLFAYAFDACLSLTLRRRWEVGFGLFPVVGSINLFGWFLNPGVAFGVVAVAVASKAFIQRDQRHIFNPSVIGVTVAGLASLRSLAFDYDGTFHALNLAPHMTEWIVLASLLPLARFSITLVTLGAWSGLAFMNHWIAVPGACYPGTIIAMTLLATDPATTPRNPSGRLLFGVFVGAAIALSSKALVDFGFGDDFSKIFPVALANLLVPAFERLTRPALFNQPLLEPRWNLLHIALYLALMMPVVMREKPRCFEAAMHWTYATPHVALGTDGVPRCADNPVFCTAFAFPRELRLWLGAN